MNTIEKKRKYRVFMYCRIGRKEDVEETNLNVERKEKDLKRQLEEWLLSELKYTHFSKNNVLV